MKPLLPDEKRTIIIKIDQEVYDEFYENLVNFLSDFYDDDFKNEKIFLEEDDFKKG